MRRGWMRWMRRMRLISRIGRGNEGCRGMFGARGTGVVSTMNAQGTLEKTRCRISWFDALAPGLLVTATGVGAGDLLTAGYAGSKVGLGLVWATRFEVHVDQIIGLATHVEPIERPTPERAAPRA